jgi:hypothetical protein
LLVARDFAYAKSKFTEGNVVHPGDKPFLHFVRFPNVKQEILRIAINKWR